MGSDDGVAVGDVLLPVSGLTFTVLLGVVLTVELPEGDYFGVFLMPAVEFLYALFVFVSFVIRRVRHHNVPIRQMPTSAPMPKTIGKLSLSRFFNLMKLVSRRSRSSS